MTRARQVLPGTTYLFVRRCLERRRLLHFDRQSRQIWRFCLALALERHGLQVHAVCVLQDQHLLVISDPLGRLSAFAQELHANLARALNRMRRRCQSLWAPGSFSATPLVGAEAVLEAMVQVMTAPVEEGLVEQRLLWPGVCSQPEDLGWRFEARRPFHFFSDPLLQAVKWGRHPSQVPEVVPYTLSRPPQLAHLSTAELRARLRERVDGAVTRIRERRRQQGLGYVGAWALRRVDPDTSAPGLTLREIRRDPWKAREQRRASREFWRRHREARLAFQAGDREVLFPAGTWAAVRVYGARVEPPPDSTAA